MRDMFSGCVALEELDIYNFNFANVHNKENIFFGCKSLKKINLSPEQIPLLNTEIKEDYLKDLKITSENFL